MGTNPIVARPLWPSTGCQDALTERFRSRVQHSPIVIPSSCGESKLLLDYAANPGGGGAGIGEPLKGTKLNPGGGGAGMGEPLAASRLKPGGGGAGIGEPLAIRQLLDKSLTELITGSTIEKARTHNASRMMILFFMDEPSWLQP